ncbi:unnamed protein product, partial [marine sediment metagenome]
EMFKLAVDIKISPRMDTQSEYIGTVFLQPQELYKEMGRRKVW